MRILATTTPSSTSSGSSRFNARRSGIGRVRLAGEPEYFYWQCHQFIDCCAKGAARAAMLELRGIIDQSLLSVREKSTASFDAKKNHVAEQSLNLLEDNEDRAGSL